MAKTTRTKAKAASARGRVKPSAARKVRRRTKGPSEKIRSLAAINVARKVGYLKLADLAGGGDASRVETLIHEKLSRRK